MALSNVELTIERRESAAAWRPRRAARCRSVVIVGKPTETNCALAAASGEQGQRAWLVQATTTPGLGEGDAAVARLDVLPTLDCPPPSRRTRRAEATCSRSTARWTSMRPTPTTSSPNLAAARLERAAERGNSMDQRRLEVSPML